MKGGIIVKGCECGSETVEVNTNFWDDTYCCECPKCKKSGPMKPDIESAIRAWNRITKSPAPTKEG